MYLLLNWPSDTELALTLNQPKQLRWFRHAGCCRRFRRWSGAKGMKKVWNMLNSETVSGQTNGHIIRNLTETAATAGECGFVKVQEKKNKNTSTVFFKVLKNYGQLSDLNYIAYSVPIYLFFT